jgi:hypothetical protein
LNAKWHDDYERLDQWAAAYSEELSNNFHKGTEQSVML